MKRNHYDFSSANFNVLKHPKEDGYFILALISAALIFILTLLLTVKNPLEVLIIIAFGVIFGWVFMELAYVKLLGNAIRVSKKAFPEIYQIYQVIHTEMELKKPVPTYIVQDGEVNGFISKYFMRRFIVLNSEMVSGMEENELERSELEWVIGRFLGAIKAKHFRFELFFFLVDQSQDTYVLNFLLFPYERATKMTGDNVGLQVNKSLEAAISALNRLMLGNRLSKDVRIEAIIHQNKTMKKHSFFAFLGKLYSREPYHIKRYFNLLGFAKKEYPDQFRAYVDRLEPSYRRVLEEYMVVY